MIHILISSNLNQLDKYEMLKSFVYYSEIGNIFFVATDNIILKAVFDMNKKFMISGYIDDDDYFNYLGLETVSNNIDIPKTVYSIDEWPDSYWLDYGFTLDVRDGIHCKVIDFFPSSYF